MKRHFSFARFVLTALLFSLVRTAMAEPIPEYEMKAAYLYNFAAFTTWPLQQDKKIRLCVLGKDSFGGSLEELTKNTIGDKHIVLSYLPNMQVAGNCQILFVDTSERPNATEILNQLRGAPVLTVTDNEDLFNAGAMIGLFVENRRLVFDINYAQAKHSRLAISSKLLRIARKVLQ